MANDETNISSSVSKQAAKPKTAAEVSAAVGVPVPNASGTDSDQRTATEFVARVADSLHDGVDQLSAAAAPVAQQLDDGITAVEVEFHEELDVARDWSDQCAQSLRSSIREHPLAAMGTAFMIGLLLARLAR